MLLLFLCAFVAVAAVVVAVAVVALLLLLVAVVFVAVAVVVVVVACVLLLLLLLTPTSETSTMSRVVDTLIGDVLAHEAVRQTASGRSMSRMSNNRVLKRLGATREGSSKPTCRVSAPLTRRFAI